MRCLFTVVLLLVSCATFADDDYEVAEPWQPAADGSFGAGDGGAPIAGATSFPGDENVGASGSSAAETAAGGSGASDAADAVSSGADAGGADVAADGADGNDTSTDPADLACGENLSSVVQGCPAVCTGGCTGTTCTILCDDESICKDANIVCPAGLDCTVACLHKASCEQATVTCSNGYGCRVVCAKENACKEMSILCGLDGGNCSLRCQHEKACESTRLICGEGACDLTCVDLSKRPIVSCPGACECDLAGCALAAEDDMEEEHD